MPVKPGRAPEPTFLNSSSQHVLEDLKYTNEDIKHIEDWTKREPSQLLSPLSIRNPATFLQTAQECIQT